MIHSKTNLGAAVLFVVPLTALGPSGCGADVQSGEPTRATKQALAPNSFAGFVLSPWLTTSGAYAVPSEGSYNSQGGTNTVRWITTGQYEVDFPGLGTLGEVQVSAVGSSNERCKVKDWRGSGNTLQVFVNCFDFRGNATNSRFTAHFSQRSDRVPQSEPEQAAYVWVDQASQTYNPSSLWQWTSDGSGITVTHNSTGNYTLTFGINITNNGGIVEVTGYGAANSDGTTNNSFCKVRDWGSNTVNVLCFDGSTHNLTDSQFDLVFSNASPNNVNSYNWAWVVGSELAAPSPWNSGLIYAGRDGNNYPYGSTPGLVSVGRSGGGPLGDYSVTYPGMGTGRATPLAVNVTGYGDGSDMCELAASSDGQFASSDGVAIVRCFDESNNPADENFTTTYNSFAYVIP